MKCPRNIVLLICDFLKERKVSLYDANKGHHRNYQRGCPQVSISGPVLWNIIANIALNITLPQNVSIQAYADDFVLLATGSGRHTIDKALSFVTQELKKWSFHVKLKFDPKKSFHLGIAKTNTRSIRPRCKLYGQPIRVSKLSKMNLQGEVLKSLYKRAIERKILYACGAWWTKTARMRNKISQIQRIALLRITECFRTVTTVALQILDGCPPIDILAEKEYIIFKLKAGYKTVECFSEIFSARDFDFEKGLDIHPALLKLLYWHKGLPNMIGYTIFTDGSKLNGHVGAAFCVFSDEKLSLERKYRLSDNASVYQAELVALREILYWLFSNSEIDPVEIYSDCESAIVSITDVCQVKI
ncbi:Hypothetical protein in type-1 retrotransposable element R1DM, partial [Stegodyphus mimosarum]